MVKNYIGAFERMLRETGFKKPSNVTTLDAIQVFFSETPKMSNLSVRMNLDIHRLECTLTIDLQDDEKKVRSRTD